MNRFLKLSNLVLSSSIIAITIVPQIALGQNSRSSIFGINSNTGERDSLNNITLSRTITQTNSVKIDNNTAKKSNLISLRLEQENKIQDAVNLSDKLMKVVLKIGNCQESSNESLESCKCQAKSEIESLERLFQSTIEKHPSWKNKTIKYPMQNSSPNVTGTGKINFPKLKKELDSGKYLGQPCQ